MAEPLLTMPPAVALQLDAITRQLLALRESVESLLLQTAALRAQYAPPPPASAPSREPTVRAPSGRGPVPVYGGEPRTRSAAGAPSLGTAALRDAVGLSDDAIGSTAVPPADEARPSDAS